MTIPPARRGDLILSQVADSGQCVVKDPRNGSYYDLGPEEAFLLEQLDGTRPATEICSAFGDHFGSALEADELDEFLELARSRGFLGASRSLHSGAETALALSDAGPSKAVAEPAPAKKSFSLGRLAGKLLYWRTNFFDPDRFFTWLEPRIRYVWTPSFLIVSGCLIAFALVLMLANFRELVHVLPRALRWETVVLAWIILGAVTFLHEFAHGLTCKHYGGEVHEVGFLLMLFIPCFYCNVSDAWLFREKRKRLYVMLAGGYCDLILWSLAIFVWRLTHPFTMVHFAACVVITICGGRVLLNFNPLMRLDGYYLLSDLAEVPNLRQRSWAYVMAHLRRILWGAPAPEPEGRARFLLLYGAISWTFCIFYISLVMFALIKLGGVRLGIIGILLACGFAFLILRNLVSGIGGGEIMKMFLYRHKRATVWSSVLLGIPMILFAIPSEERAGGAFQIRAVNRVEMRAKVSGFLEEVWFDEGQPVSQGETIARLEIPDLESKIAQKQAEVKEGAYRLDLLVAGASELERNEQKARVERALKWCELAQADLDRFRLALADELRKLDQQINQYRSQRDFERDKFFLDDKLYQKGVIPKEEYLDSKKRFEVAQSQLEQAQSDKKARETAGTQAAEAELARRQKEHKEAEAMLSLMNAGTRKETIDAEQARQARLVEELKYLRSLEKKVVIEAPIKGKIILPRISAGSHENESVATRLHERVGQYFHEGDLICIIEDPTELEADIAVDEQESARVVEGQTVDLKVRALPFSTFKGSVQRVAPGAVPGEAQSTVHVYCRIENPSSDLKPGLSGHARLHCGRRQLGVMLLERGMRYLRTEVWW